jgi:hypothetical protein
MPPPNHSQAGSVFCFSRGGWDMKRRCDSCGGRFGLTRHKWFGYHFCREACKKDFLVKLAGQREQLRLWLGYLARGSTT